MPAGRLFNKYTVIVPDVLLYPWAIRDALLPSIFLSGFLNKNI
jgi:hypothetical protein